MTVPLDKYEISRKVGNNLWSYRNFLEIAAKISGDPNPINRNFTYYRGTRKMLGRRTLEKEIHVASRLLGIKCVQIHTPRFGLEYHSTVGFSKNVCGM